MRKQAQELKYFLYSQAFADGLRTTFAILLPALVSSYLGYFELGLSISLGALCVSLTDIPGAILNKRNGMLFTSFFALVVSAITALARFNVYLLGLEIFLFSFFFSMFNAYGNRASAVGSAAILLMILTMDKPLKPEEILPHSIAIFAGGIWYMLISVMLYNLRPYRQAQRALGDSIRQVAAYLSIKADFYNLQTSVDHDYKKLVAQQIVVHEKQDTVREILFKTRQTVSESTATGKNLVLTFVETVDLFEDITAAYYDYDALRERFGHTGLLQKISTTIKQMARELDKMGIAIQTQSSYQKTQDFEKRFKELKEEIDALDTTGTTSKLVLKKILVNLRKLVQRLNDISGYFAEKPAEKTDRTTLDHSRFVGHQPLDPKVFWNNLSPDSGIFKHALRVAVACVIGFIIAKFIAYGHHSYWILLTIAFIIKPAFSLTKQRNGQRIAGTLIGGAIGLLILIFIPNTTVQFLFMVLLMLGTYTFLRINYLAMVICTTPYVLILFKFFGVGFIDLAQERILDTIVGGTVAFAVSYFMFPIWESEQIGSLIGNMLKANANYMKKILQGMNGEKISLLHYKLARKDVYVNSANLSAAFQRMLSEPRNKQKNSKQVHQFVVLSHILFSNIATVATTIITKDVRVYPTALINTARKGFNTLNAAIKKTGGSEVDLKTDKKQLPLATDEAELSADDVLLKEQLEFINKLCHDLDKITEAIIAE
jgi:uncharacterized membrane protein (TIGR01666 family)